MRVALVLSGGGIFGAWQAGVWSAIRDQFEPDMVVGASVGCLNGYLIASAIEPDDLRHHWMDPRFANFRNLAENLQHMVANYRPRTELGIALTDAYRMKPRVVRDADITWQHLAASCAIPGVLPMYRLEGRLYADGGLLNPLPVWAAAEMGATHCLGLNVLPEPPSALISPFIRLFRATVGHNPPLPVEMQCEIAVPSSRPLGSMRDALVWNRANVERWWEQGRQDAKNISILNCLKR